MWVLGRGFDGAARMSQPLQPAITPAASASEAPVNSPMNLRRFGDTDMWFRESRSASVILALLDLIAVAWDIGVRATMHNMHRPQRINADQALCESGLCNGALQFQTHSLC